MKLEETSKQCKLISMKLLQLPSHYEIPKRTERNHPLAPDALISISSTGQGPLQAKRHLSTDVPPPIQPSLRVVMLS